MYPFAEYEKHNCASKFNILIINAMFPYIYASENLPTRSSVIIDSEWIWGLLTRNLTRIRLRGFLYQGVTFEEISLGFLKNVVSISWVLTVFLRVVPMKLQVSVIISI